MEIKKLRKKDLGFVAKIASASFSGLKDLKKAKLWIECNFKAYPRMQYFAATLDGKIAGYILWVEKGGFRENAVFELEQIAVAQNLQGGGVGKELILKSLEEIKKYLAKQNRRLKIIEVTTGTENKAQNLYKKTLKAEVEALIKDFFRGDEAIMIARV